MSNLENRYIIYICLIKQKRFAIQGFLDILLYDCICRCSANLEEHLDLQEKAKEISQVSQKIYTLSLLTDKLQREKL